MKRLKSSAFWFFASLLTLLAGPLLLAASGALHGAESWQSARRDSANIAPTPEQAPEAIVQVYGARAWSWRGYFAVHTWIATKEAGASHYLVHEVTGWRRAVVRSRIAAPVPGGLGYQLSLGGYLGVLAGVREGIELNVLGLSLGINPRALGIKLPGIGELALLNPNPMPEGGSP